MNHLSFEVIQEWNEVWSPNHLEKWMNILQQSDNTNVFVHPTLLRAWTETYLPLRKLKPVFVWSTDNAGNEALMPLVLWHHNWKHAYIKTIVPMGFSDFDFHDPLSLHPIKDKEEYWEQLFNFVKKNVFYDRIIIDSISDPFIGSSSRWQRNEKCPYIALNDISDENQLLQFLGNNLRHDIRRRIRRFEQMGDVSLFIYKSWDEAYVSFKEFLEEHSRRWPQAYKAPSFHENLFKAGLNSGLTHFSSLNIGNKPIAWHLGFVYKRRFFHYMTALHSEYAAYSPSKIHLYLLVKWAIENKCTVFDFLRGDENYKSGWSNGYQHVHSITIENNSFTSELKKALLKLRP